MVDRLEMAKQYVQEMLEKRDDIVGAFVVGSVARGEADETSDIDLILIVAGDGGEGYQREGVNTWRDEVYIEAALVPKGLYADVEKVLKDRIAATHMNDALILYDLGGSFTRVQDGVRAVFKEPRYVGIRVHPVVRRLREQAAGLKAEVAARDLLGVCPHVRRISFWLPSVPLLVNQITPSSTKQLIQLERVAPELKDRICQWQGTSGLTAADAQALLPTLSKCLYIGRVPFASEWGDVPGYVVKKVAWMMDNGLHREALNLTWIAVGDLGRYAGSSVDGQMVSDTEKLVRDWFRAVGWEGQEVLEEKVRMAEEMVEEVAAMAAHLPSDEAAEAG